MAKISQVSAKYIVHATIEIDGVVDRPDVIGAIFGQTEGLLGQDLELRELQRSGRIGRIEVNSDTKAGKTSGMIIVPSSLDKAETAIIAAALEIIQRIGPCNAKIHVEKIEDVRISKRAFVIERAKELLHTLTDSVLPDSSEIAEEVAHSVRMMEAIEYGKDKLPAGPGIDEQEEVILVEGRADVLNLLKHGFKNVIAMNGSSVPQTIIDLSHKKTMTAFVDGDRGGDLNIQELLQTAELDFVTKAPDGKEVEELTKKEIHKCLRARMSTEQAKLEFVGRKPMPKPSASAPIGQVNVNNGINRFQRPPMQQRPPVSAPLPPHSPPVARPLPRPVTRGPTNEEKVLFRQMLDDLIGTRGANILDDKLKILGKVPISELIPTLNSLSSGVYAIVMDGPVDKDVIASGEKTHARYMIGSEAQAKGIRTTVLVREDLN
jgi:DNA primase